MKKILSLMLTAVIILSLAACGSGKTKQAFEASQIAYDNINSAYEITENFGSDIYEAWRLAITDKDEIRDEGWGYLGKELSLSKEDFLDGVAYTQIEMAGGDWEKATDEKKEEYRKIAESSLNTLFEYMEDEFFSWCVMIVSNAYTVNGKVDEIQTYLNNAKTQMKDLSENYSDYEHYPSLKGYYTTTNSFFEFCQNPTGSFEQLKTTMEDYRTTARDYKADLDYIFEE